MSNESNTETTDTSTPELGALMNESEHIAVEVLLDEPSELDRAVTRKTFDQLFETLADPGKRYVLTYLLRSEGYVRMTQLVDYVMTRTQTAKSNEQFRQQITAELTHNLLPELVDDEFVSYNMERQLISPQEKLTLVGPYLRIALVQQRSSPETESD
jgi:hypothetical protein